jgi:hypothetical protein
VLIRQAIDRGKGKRWQHDFAGRMTQKVSCFHQSFNLQGRNRVIGALGTTVNVERLVFWRNLRIDRLRLGSSL